MATNQQVAEAFVRGQEANSEHMFSTGAVLFSYRLQIAHHYGKWDNQVDRPESGIVLDYTERRGHTITTQRHMRELEAALRLS